MSTNCSECGAKLGEGASVCDLCGSPVQGNVPSQPEINDDESDAREASESVAEPAPIPDEHIFCNQCGWQNPVGSNFCSSCGSTLQRLAPTAVRSASSRRREGPGPKKPVA
ncbi:MAG: zinc ribbon domain-containing protein, partial [Bacteroidetes bacterium]|nr:zinc ribbon domain-containing protein [Bacteroidota bacterium]